jgi:Fe-S cluster biogenesis protein NfuA
MRDKVEKALNDIRMTLKQGIESHVKKAVPEVLSVEAV